MGGSCCLGLRARAELPDRQRDRSRAICRALQKRCDHALVKRIPCRVNQFAQGKRHDIHPMGVRDPHLRDQHRTKCGDNQTVDKQEQTAHGCVGNLCILGVPSFYRPQRPAPTSHRRYLNELVFRGAARATDRARPTNGSDRGCARSNLSR